MKDNRQLKNYVALGLTVVLSAAALLIFYDSVFANHTLVAFLGRLMKALLPVLYGCIMAYLLLPLVNLLDGAFRRAGKKLGQKKQHPALCRALSVLGAWLLVVIVVYALFSIAIPQLVSSVNELSAHAEEYYNEVYGWANDILERNSDVTAWVLTTIDESYEELSTWLRENVLPQATIVMEQVGSGIVGFFRFLLNFLIGIIVSVYLLFSKENWAAAARRTVAADFSEEHQALILRGTHRVDTIFSGYIRGKLIGSLLLGVVCLLACTLLKIPYAPIVSLLVGVTNIIPFFGPFLGAVPSGLLILLVSPAKCLTFIILILVLQQIDGNIIDPRIVGSSIGLSGLWVLMAILVGGAFFGIAGMFFSVPVFACIHDLINWFVGERLHKKGLSAELEDYRKDS